MINQTQMEPVADLPAAPAPPPAREAPHGAHLAAPGARSAPPAAAGRTPILVLAALGIALGILAWITLSARSHARTELETDTTENLAPAVAVIHPKRTSAQVQLELPGNLTAFEEAPIYARVSGYLKHWFTDIGTHVAAGQVL